MRLSSLESRLERQLLEAIPGVTPGIVVQVYKSGRKMIDIAVGDTSIYYDLASVTKIIFTTQAFMKSFELGKWNLQSKVVDFISDFPFSDMTLVSCLNHSSGLQWWEPFYEMIDPEWSLAKKWEQVFARIYQLPREVKAQSVYSDLGFLVLGKVLTKFYDKSLEDIWLDLKTEFYPGTTLNFHPNNSPIYPRKLYASTENSGWRKMQIQGEVNDDNTWSLGGVAPQAGLFGSIDDLSWYALLLRAQTQGVARNSIRLKTARLFAARSRLDGQGDWALGFMMPAKENSLVGDYFSQQSIGHWGFTGASVWYDPHQDLVVSVLSNRTLYGRDKKDFNFLRPKMHNWIIEGLRRS